MLVQNPENSVYRKACSREASFWQGHEDYAFEIPNKVKEYENMAKYGDSHINDISYLNSLGKFKKGLSLGAGGGTFELDLLESKIVDHFHFIDISSQALSQLEENAIQRGLQDKISVEIQDVNFLKLKSEAYDFICVINALHHIINLEEVIFEINKGLTANGVFFTIDCICEQKMVRSDTKMALMNTFINYMKENHSIICYPFIRTNPKVLTNNCPFECIRSHELENILLHYFQDSKIVHSTYRPLFFAWGGLIKYENISDIFLEELKIFDEFAHHTARCKPNRLLGIYKKSSAPLLSSKPRTPKQLHQNIGVSQFNEKKIMMLSLKLRNKFPQAYNLFKRLYFSIR